MIIFSTKLTKAKIITIALVSACLVLLLLISLPSSVEAGKRTPIEGKTNEQRISYLNSFGWEVSADPVEVMDVAIPSEFDASYENYNELQQQQGFDLSKLKGKKVTRYTYTISNYPSAAEETVYANVLVLDNDIVGGDVSSVALGGFMHTLQMPGKDTDAVPDTDQTSSTATTDTVTDPAGLNTDEIKDGLDGVGK